MTIRQKTRLSNIMTLFFPVLFIVIFFIVLLQTSLGSYWHTLMTMYSDDNGVLYARSMIYTYQQELWENNWGQGEDDNELVEINRSDEMYHLEEKLSKMGYQFMITKDGVTVFSNISDDVMEIGRSVAGDAISTAKTLTASRYEVSVIKNTFYHGDKVFCITAIHHEETDQEIVTYLRRSIIRYLLAAVLLFVVVSLCVNGIMSWWITWSVLIPLGKLSQATKEIREGNLDKKIHYDKVDEFGEFCRDFDEMRIYLKQSVEQRLRDEKRRKNLITGISHDLRTPLTSISGYLDGLMEGIADTPKKRERYLEAIKIRTGNLISLVDSLSEYCRLDMGFHYHLEMVDMKDFLHHYLNGLEQEAVQNKVQIEYSDEGGSYPVRIDQNEMKRVFENLFTNTIRYREQDTSRILIILRKNGSDTMIEVVFKDDGPGVPDDSLDMIFDSFYRVDDSRYKSEKGSGIGLAVVREIIIGHGGMVRAENRRGLAVVIRLPIAKEDFDETSVNC